MVSFLATAAPLIPCTSSTTSSSPSKLNPCAPSFCPGAITHSTTTSAIAFSRTSSSDRSNRHNLSPTAAEFVPHFTPRTRFTPRDGYATLARLDADIDPRDPFYGQLLDVNVSKIYGGGGRAYSNGYARNREAYESDVYDHSNDTIDRNGNAYPNTMYGGAYEPRGRTSSISSNPYQNNNYNGYRSPSISSTYPLNYASSNINYPSVSIAPAAHPLYAGAMMHGISPYTEQTGYGFGPQGPWFQNPALQGYYPASVKSGRKNGGGYGDGNGGGNGNGGKKKYKGKKGKKNDGPSLKAVAPVW